MRQDKKKMSKNYAPNQTAPLNSSCEESRMSLQYFAKTTYNDNA